jgi:hypothetical protein
MFAEATYNLWEQLYRLRDVQRGGGGGGVDQK